MSARDELLRKYGNNKEQEKEQETRKTGLIPVVTSAVSSAGKSLTSALMGNSPKKSARQLLIERYGSPDTEYAIRGRAAKAGLEKYRKDTETRTASIPVDAWWRNAFVDPDRSPNDNWKEDWLEEFGVRYDSDPEDAYSYAKQVNDHLAAQKLAKEEAEYKEWAADHEILATGAALVTAPFALLDVAEKGVDFLADGEISQRDSVTLGTLSRTLTSGVAEGLNEEYGVLDESIPIIGGKGWGDVYSLGNSVLQSWGLGNTIGAGATLATFFGQGASAGMEEIKARGGSDWQAILYGLISGGAEVLTEKLPLDNLLKGGDAVHYTLNSWLRNAAKQAGLEGSEELISSVANEMADRWIMGDKSKFEVNVQQYMAEGLSRGEAEKKAWLDYANDAAFDFFGGAASGGTSMMAQTALPTAMANRETRQAYTPKMEDSLLKLALEAEEGSWPQKLAQKYQGKDGKLTGGQINQLAGVYEQYTDQQETDALTEDASSRLEALEAENDTAARAIAKTIVGQELTRSEKKALEGSAEAKKILQEMRLEQELPDAPDIPDAGSPWKPGNPMVRHYEQNRDPLVAKLEQAEQQEDSFGESEGIDRAEPSGVSEQFAADNATNATDNATAVLDNTANAAETVAEPVAKPVEAAVEGVENTAPETADSASTVEESAENTPSFRTVEEVAEGFGNQAGEVRKMYQDGQDVDAFEQGVRAAWELGNSGIPMERAVSSPRTQGITEHQRKQAYLLGQGAARLAAQGKATANAKAATGGTVRRKGAVKGRGVSIQDLSKTFNDPQKTAYKLLSFYAEVTGVDVVLYKGKQEQETGRFAHGENTIYIDITAGTNGWDATDLGAYTMMRTFSHEFVHFVEKWNPTAYNDLREAVFAEMEKNGSDPEAQVELAMQEQGLTFDQASREVVAEALTDILPESQFVQTLANKHKSLFDKLKERLEAFVSELKAHWKKLTGNNSREAVALKRQVGDALEYAEEIVQMFSRAAGEAVEAYQATVATENVTQEVEIYGIQEAHTGAEAESERKLESSAEFADRIRTAGGEIFEIGGRQYGYRKLDRGVHSAQRAEKTQRKLIDLGVDAFIIDGDIEVNDGRSTARYSVRAAATLPNGAVAIGPKINTREMETVYHELLHSKLRRNDNRACAYLDSVAQNFLIENDSALGYYTTIAEAYESKGIVKIREELAAYISGHIADGVIDKSMFADYRAVYEAWKEFSGWDGQKAEQPKPKTTTPEHDESMVSVTDERFRVHPRKDGGLVVAFTKKAPDAVRQVLKDRGFKWKPKGKHWEGKGDKSEVADALRAAYGDTPAEVEVEQEKPVAQQPDTKEVSKTVIEAAPEIEKEDVNHGEHEAEAGGVLDHRADGTGDSGVLGDREAGAGAADDGGRDSVGVPAAGGREAVRHGSGADAQRSERGSDDGGSQSRVSELTDEAPAGELSEAVQELSERSAPREPDAGNWVIGDSLDLPQGDKARIRANLDAIAIVKRLEAAGQRATAAEQASLAKYVGWGGLDGIFNEYRKEHADEREELKKLLTDQEFRAARASTTTAFYTDIGIIRAVYDGLTALGFTGGRILEPAAGVGHFAGAMPSNVRQSVKSMTMVELDSITGAIAKHLYPGMDVRVEGFETTNLPNNYMDAAVGNVPFGNFGVVDKNYPKKITGTIHNYFFAKTLDKVRPGGIVVMLTSRYTMDSNDSTAREYISKKADLLGAIRLPDNAFKSNAGTEVVSDILIFKKRAVGTPYAGADFVTGPKHAFGNNPYFDIHPEMVLGTIEQKHGRYGFGSTVKAREGDLGQQIREAFGKIEGRMDYPATRDREHTNFVVERGARKPRNGGYSLRDGKLIRTENGQTVDHKLDEKTAKRVAGMVGIRDAARKLQNAQLQGQNPASIGKARKELNSLYDAFVKEHGYLNAPANKKAMQDDPDRYSILALENWDTDTRKATKADIFSKNTVAPNRTVTSADTVEEGLIVSRNQTGGVDTDLIARLTGRSAEEVTRELIDTRLAFKRSDGTLEAAETYLSGNVRAKLREAEGLAPVDRDFHNNAEALRPLIPRDIPHTEIFVNPGATWVPAQLYGDFAAELLGGTNSEWRQDVKVTYHPQTGSYAVSLNSSYLKGNARNTQKYGTPRKPFHEILEAVLNSKSITVWDKVGDTRVVNEQATAAANEKAELLGEELRKWLWKDEVRRTELTRLYNEQFNCLVNPKYDGSKLTFNGMNAGMQLRPHQLDAVARIISSGGNTLLAHRVGAGKTFEMAAAAMKLRELGLVKKPMFAVPKSLVAQWGKEFSDLFPAARLLVAEPGDFTADNRRTFANRIANGDYDAVIVSYEQFERLPISSDFAARLCQEQVDSLVDAIAEAKAEEGKRASVKDLERSRKTLENKIKKLADGAKDDDIRFEELGVDALFVDEAHNFKNLFYTTSMTNVAGLGNRDGSKRAFDLYTKVRYLQQLNGGKGIVFATATPVMNSMAEMYIMQRYLQPQMLHDLGIENFDAWAKQFGEVVNGLEVNPSGTGYRIKQSFSRFKNLPELQLLFRNMADVMTTVPGLKIPKMKGGKPIIVECEPGEYQQQYMKELAHRCETVKGKDPRVDNMLKITSDGRKIAYTQRMIDPSLPYEEGCKLYRCADNVLEVYKKTAKDSGAQMIFLDMATPKGKSSKEDGSTDEGMDMENAQLYDDLRQRLIEGGIPKKEIAFIHDADTDAKKKKLFQDVNEGKVRVLIGSTGKMGVGMNAQRRAVAIHHLDAPWRPGDVEQRNGRVFRQGNQNKEVSCYYYVTKGSYDARLWNKLDTKQHFVEQVMNGTDVGRDVEDTGEITLSAAEAMAVASGSPLIMEQVKLENEIKKLESLRRAHSQAAAEAVTGLAKNQAEAKQLEGWIEKAGQDLKRRTNAWQEKTFSVTIGKKVYKDRKDAGPALMKAAEKAAVESGYTTIGSFAGFNLRVVKTAEGIKAMLSGAQGYTFKTYPNNLSYMVKAMCDAAGGIEGAKQRWENRLERTQEDIAEQKKLLDKPFDKEQQLQKARSRYREVMAELAPKQEQRMDRLEAEDGDQKQVRRIALTDRQVLELFADEALPKDASSAERDAFAIFRKRLERLQTLQQDRAELGRQYKEQQFGPDGDRAKAKETAGKMEALDKSILKAADEVLSAEEAPVMRRVIQSARDAARRKQAKHDQDLLKEYRAKRAESDGQRKYRRAVQREVKELQNFILHPDTKRMKLCPEFLQKPVLEFLSTIDQSSKRKLSGGGDTQADQRFANRLADLTEILEKATGKDDDGNVDIFEGYLDLPGDFLERVKKFSSDARKLTEKVGDRNVVNEMTAAQLHELLEVLTGMKTLIRNANTFHSNAMFQHISQAGGETVTFTRKHKDWSKARGKLAALGNMESWVFWKNVRPALIFQRFGKAGLSILQELMDGQDKLARNTKTVVDFAKKTYTDKEVKVWEEQRKTIRLSNGKHYRLTVAQIMGLYCMAKREQAVDHLTHGGFVIQDENGGIRKVHMTIDDLGVFSAALSNRQQAVADKLQKFMSERGGEWGNYVTLHRFGIRVYGEEFYYPLATYDEKRSASIDKPEGSDLHALLNMSFTKQLTKGAKNAVMAYSIFDVFADHMGAMAQYNAMALPVLDAVKWLNWSQSTVNEKGFEDTVGVKTELRRVFGIPPAKRGKGGNVSVNKGYAEHFILNLLKSYNSTSPQATPNDKLGLGMLHRYNRSQVAFNRSVVLKQPLAIFRAMQVLSPASIAKGANPAAVRQGLQEMLGHSGIAIWKDLGFYDVNVSKGMGKLIRRDSGILDKVTDAGMFKAEWADKITWAMIWNGCKAQCGGNMKKTAELFNKVIYESQVVDSVLTKTEYMRDQGLGSRLLSSFMSEPVTAVSPLLNDVFLMNMEMQRKGGSFQTAWQKHGRHFVRSTAVYAVTGIITAVASAFIAAWRDDDDYQDFDEKFREAMDGAIGEELNPFTKLPLLGDAVEGLGALWQAVVEGEDPWLALSSLPMGEIIQYAVDGGKILHDLVSGKDTNYTWYGAVRKLLQAFSGATGIPAATLSREVVDTWNNIVGRMAPSLKVKTYEQKPADALRDAFLSGYVDEDEAVAKLIELGKAEDENEAYWKLRSWEGGSDWSKYDALAQAMANGEDISGAMDELTTHGVKEKDVRKQIRSIVGQWLEQGAITPEEAEQLLVRYGGESQEEAEQAVRYWEFKKDNPGLSADDSWIDKYYSDIQDTGIGIEDYVSYRNQVKGITGEGKKQRRMEVIDSLPISDEQKDALYYSEGWAASTIGEAPWH